MKERWLLLIWIRVNWVSWLGIWNGFWFNLDIFLIGSERRRRRAQWLGRVEEWRQLRRVWCLGNGLCCFVLGASVLGCSSLIGIVFLILLTSWFEVPIYCVCNLVKWVAVFISKFSKFWIFLGFWWWVLVDL